MKRELSYTPSEDELDVTPGSTTSTTPPTSAPSTPSPGKKAKVAKPRAPKAPKEAGAKKKDLSAVNRTWTPELKVSFIEILLDRGKAASDMTELMNTTGLSKTQLSTALQKGNPTNLRAQVLKAVGALGAKPTKEHSA